MRQRVDYLDGLRALAVMAVVTIHYGGFGLNSFGPVGRSLVEHGKYGVTIFFVLSAYSLCLSIDGRPANWPDFFIRRFFRIAPMYWLACLFVFFLRNWSGAGPSFTSLLSHLTFANIIDLQHANDLIFVEWSIPVEVSFYLLFPMIFTLTSRAPIATLLLGVLLSLPMARYALFQSFEFRAYTLPWHLPAFLAGMLAYFWLPKVEIHPGLWLAGIVGCGLILSSGESVWSAPTVVCLTVAVIALCQRSRIASTFVGLPPFAVIGKISFSIYLTHYIVGPLLVDPMLSLATTLFVSAVTYFLIEQPGQTLGRILTQRTRRAEMTP